MTFEQHKFELHVNFFSVVNTTVLYDPWIVESTDANHIYEGNADTKELRIYMEGQL